jgi:hypothetical protein
MADRPVRYAKLKELVAGRISGAFEAYRERKKELLKDRKKVRSALEAGAKKARRVAERTMEDVRKKTGLR